MSRAGAWLDERTPAMPSELRRAVEAAVMEDAVSQADLPDRLAEAGLGALSRAIEATDRGAALDLLVADALLTYACEAAAEEGPAALDRVTAALDLKRFAVILEPRTP